jgi:hypothetical protein
MDVLNYIKEPYFFYLNHLVKSSIFEVKLIRIINASELEFLTIKLIKKIKGWRICRFIPHLCRQSGKGTKKHKGHKETQRAGAFIDFNYNCL